MSAQRLTASKVVARSGTLSLLVLDGNRAQRLTASKVETHVQAFIDEMQQR